MNEIIHFQLEGKFAHFRKFYTNNTALSFTLPPRTTVMGIVAAMLSIEKDTYYKKLSSENFAVSVGLGSSIKKSFHRLNLLMIKGMGDFRGKLGRIQTPFEIIMPQNLKDGSIVYNFFVAAKNGNSDITSTLIDVLKKKKPNFNITLGVANFHASIINYDVISNGDFSVHTADNEELLFNSCVPSNSINAITSDFENNFHIEEEHYPCDFINDFDRELKRMQRLVYSTNAKPISLNYSGEYLQIKLENETKNICFI